jgi:hypothetical protein
MTSPGVGPISKFGIFALERIAQHVVIQGDHRKRIIHYFRILIEAARKQFTEDNKLSLDSFLMECFEEALREDGR